MSLLGMPWVVINLGCEMVYILEQRLKAQGITPDKSVKVLQDIVCTMFDSSFMTEKLFVPQEMYSLASTRKIFDRLAHSSIMRLSESSMDKLFDLMVMGAKYQLMCSTKLDDMIQVMLRHLGTVQAILTTAMATSSQDGHVDADTSSLVGRAEDATVKFYGTLSIGELALLRHTLARFFQEKRVKVSLFLTEGIQLQSGKLVVPSCISDQVGVVRTFNDAGQIEGEEKFKLNSQKADMNEFFCHPVPLGDNLYRKDRIKAVPPPRSEDAGGAKASQQQPTAAQQPKQSARYVEDQPTQGSKAAAQELDLLAALVQVNKSGTDNFRLNLFDDANEELGVQPAGPAAAAATGRKQHQELEFGREGRNDDYIKAVGLGDVLEAVGLEGQTGSKTIGEDLLDLMDSVS